jgi:hypothetical protein
LFIALLRRKLGSRLRPFSGAPGVIGCPTPGASGQVFQIGGDQEDERREERDQSFHRRLHGLASGAGSTSGSRRRTPAHSIVDRRPRRSTVRSVAGGTTQVCRSPSAATSAKWVTWTGDSAGESPGRVRLDATRSG